MSFIENAVPLAEVAKATRSTAAAIKAEAVALNIFVGEDWACRPAVESRDAHGLVTGVARRDAENSAANVAHTLAVEAWEAERMTVWRTAYNEAFERARRAGIGGGEALTRAKEATRDAVERFETDTPLPTNGASSGGRNWFAKVKEVARANVKEVAR